MQMLFRDRWFTKQATALKQGMYVTALSILKNESDTEDAIQNAVMIAYKNLDALSSKDKFKPWIFRILKNECYRIIKLRSYSLDDEVEIEDPKSDVDHEGNMTLWEAVNKLDEKYREVVMLYYYQGFKIPEVANILEISGDNVKQRLSRARKELKVYLEDYYG